MISGTALANWEMNRTVPAVRFRPRIIAYLGYCPWWAPRTDGERLQQQREALGFSRKRLARALRVDEHTAAQWERGRSGPRAGVLEALRALWQDQGGEA
jgi:DNA-binding transcriptional regulator YiaG